MSDKRGYSGTGDKADLDNRSNQCNPNNERHQGYSSAYSGTGTKVDLDNHSNQLNPNNERYQPKKQVHHVNWLLFNNIILGVNTVIYDVHILRVLYGLIIWIKFTLIISCVKRAAQVKDELGLRGNFAVSIPLCKRNQNQWRLLHKSRVTKSLFSVILTGISLKIPRCSKRKSGPPMRDNS